MKRVVIATVWLVVGCTGSSLPTPPAAYWPAVELGRAPVRSTTVSAAVNGYAPYLGLYTGGIAHQITRDVSVGGGGGALTVPHGARPGFAGWARARYNPGTDHFMVYTGLGGGALDNDGYAGYLSGELGVRAGFPVERVKPSQWGISIGAVGGFGGPVGVSDRTGIGYTEVDPTTHVLWNSTYKYPALVPTGHFSFDCALTWQPVPRLAIIGDVIGTTLFEVRGRSSASFVVWGGSLGVQYTFGGEMPARE